ncbi:universal stress protein [Nocardia higoensis]|uniref:Universal stress protein n=1 Tax=Nocardia higoensis TaxID=228599 RepID=A0ABS0D512_9NOCA|nr:universal stress protein [Nocardia higoensis]MBF6353575.1 universal stress protein [Nocardia higoensis]
MSVPHALDPHRSRSAAVVVGVDGSVGSERAVRWAATMAARRGRQLVLVHALDIDPAHDALTDPDGLGMRTVRERGVERLLSAAAVARRVEPGVVIDTASLDGGAAPALIGHSPTAHLLVLGATGTGGAATHLGSTLLAVTGHAEGSVVVVRDSEFTHRDDGTGPVVVGIDADQRGGLAGHRAVEAAFAEASERGCALVAVHAWSDLPFGELDEAVEDETLPETEAAAAALLGDGLAPWREKYPEVTVEQHVYRCGARHHLVMWSKTAQLLVVGARGRGGFPGLPLGSTANAMIQRAHCPVLVAHDR